MLGCRGRWQPGLGLAEEAMSSRCFLDVFRRKLPKDLALCERKRKVKGDSVI